VVEPTREIRKALFCGVQGRGRPLIQDLGPEYQARFLSPEPQVRPVYKRTVIFIGPGPEYVRRKPRKAELQGKGSGADTQKQEPRQYRLGRQR
jgi:hypothetical protein